MFAGVLVPTRDDTSTRKYCEPMKGKYYGLPWSKRERESLISLHQVCDDWTQNIEGPECVFVLRWNVLWSRDNLDL